MIPPSTRVRRAIELHSLPLVKRILSANEGDDVLLRNADLEDNGTTSLHLCAVHGLPNIATYLLSLGHEDTGVSRTTTGVTPLMLACQAGDDDNATVAARVEVGRMLIEGFPEHVCIQDKAGMDAFAHAAASGTNSLLQLLLSKPLHPFALSNMQDRILNTLPGAPDEEEDDLAPLKPTTSFNGFHVSNVQPIPLELQNQLSALVNTQLHPLITSRDLNGNTPLHHASASGHLKTLRLLISSGADAQARNVFTWTAVDYSATVSAEVYMRKMIKETLAAKGIATGRQSPTTGRSSPAGGFGSPPSGLSSPAVAFPSHGIGSPVGVAVGSPTAGRSSPVPTAAQVARMRGGSDETGRGSPAPSAFAMGRFRGESDEKRRPAGGVRLVQREETPSEEDEESEDGGGIGRARTTS